jgi:hypothetical protein
MNYLGIINQIQNEIQLKYFLFFFFGYVITNQIK